MEHVLGFVEACRSRLDPLQLLAAVPDPRMVQLAVGDLIQAQDKAAGVLLCAQLCPSATAGSAYVP